MSKRLQDICDKFNSKWPVGTRVVLRKDSGDLETKVTHPGYVLGKHSAVAFFEGVSGCYSIENGRVRSSKGVPE